MYRSIFYVIVIVICHLVVAAKISYSAGCTDVMYPTSADKSAESIYSNIFLYKTGPCIKMTFRRVGSEFNESEMNISDANELPVPYTRIITVSMMYPDKIDKVAMIGVGGGTTLNYLSSYLAEAKYIGVELDPKVLEFAQEDFRLGRNKKIKLVESDGRMFLLRSKELYDVIILDAFRGGYIPSHLLTKEFYQLTQSRLSGYGVVAINLHAGDALFDSSLKTVKEVFPQVDAYSVGGSVILVGSNRKIESAALVNKAKALQDKYSFRYPLQEILKAQKKYDVPLSAKLLTDDYSPANQLAEIKTISNEKRSW